MKQKQKIISEKFTIAPAIIFFEANLINSADSKKLWYLGSVELIGPFS